MQHARHIRPKEPGGSNWVHKADLYVWAAIHYLDSSTDYRECLPGNITTLPSSAVGAPMVLLDDVCSCSLWRLFTKYCHKHFSRQRN